MSKSSRLKRQHHSVPTGQMPSGETDETAFHLFGPIRMSKTPNLLIIEGSSPIEWRHRFYSLAFMLGWTFGCVMLPYLVFSPKGDMPMWGRFLFLALFWGAWPFVILVLLRRNWSWEALQVKENGVEYRLGVRFCGVFVSLRKRIIPINEVGLALIDNCRDGQLLESDLMLPTTGRPIHCFYSLNKVTSAKAFLAPLNNRLKQLGVVGNNRRFSKSHSDPFDCRWMIHGDARSQVLTRSGGVKPSLLGGTVFLCVLLIGIPAVFVVGIADMWMKGENLFTFQSVFLVVIALAILPFGLWGGVVLLMMCLQYFCRYKIILDNQEVRYRRSWCGIGWNRTWRYIDFAKVTAEYRTLKFLQLDMIRNPELADAGDGRTNPYPFVVRLLNADDELLGTIPDLLENEAILIAEQIRQKKSQPTRYRRED